MIFITVALSFAFQGLAEVDGTISAKIESIMIDRRELFGRDLYTQKRYQEKNVVGRSSLNRPGVDQHEDMARYRRVFNRPSVDQREVKPTNRLHKLLELLDVRSFDKRQDSTYDQDFLDAHNEKRRSILNPTASNMKKMIWSEELASIARQYAEQCAFQHNSQRHSQSQTFNFVGENIYVISPSLVPPGTAVQSWFDEKIGYNYADGSCDTSFEASKYGCGHYTQVVWANSEYVGCTLKHCPNGISEFTSDQAYLYICNYGPAGNFNNEKPYKTGTACSECESGYTCENNLCTKSSSDPCANVNCGSNGQCVSGSCQCNSGWTGSNCGTQISDPCANVNCGSNGQCVDGSCQCNSGWTGSNCGTQISDPCANVNCGSNGQCVDGSCQCNSGWTGSNCGTQITDPCANVNCGSNGQCVGGSCQCNSGWTGSNCGTQITNSNQLYFCGFETNMCMSNYDQDDLDYDKYQTLTSGTKSISSGADGSTYFVALKSSSSSVMHGDLDNTESLPNSVLTIKFKYNIIRQGRLRLYYLTTTGWWYWYEYSGETNGWHSREITTVAPLNMFYFRSFVGGNSGEDVVAIDNVTVEQ